MQDKTKSLSFVEAKSSSPKPEPANNTNFDEFIEEIRNKFLHSLNLYYAAILRRHEKIADIPTDFQNLNNEDISIKLVLVIKGHQFAWLAPIREALCRALIPYESIWHFDIAVINDEMALKYGLISYLHTLVSGLEWLIPFHAILLLNSDAFSFPPVWLKCGSGSCKRLDLQIITTSKLVV